MAPRKSSGGGKKRKRVKSSQSPASPAEQEISLQDQERIRQAFDEFDGNDDGIINGRQARNAIRNMVGFDIDKHEIRQWFVKNDKNDQSLKQIQVDLDAFVECASHYWIQQLSVKQAFALFDEEKKGFISIQDLRRVAHDELDHEDIADEELQEMLEIGEDGIINQQDFYQIMKKIKLV